jgi:hypothetical protein
MPIYHYNRPSGKSNKWPELFWSPEGECKLFYSINEVPESWSTQKPIIVFNEASAPLNHDELIAELVKRDIEINPIWGDAHMKRILDGDISSTR